MKNHTLKVNSAKHGQALECGECERPACPPLAEGAAKKDAHNIPAGKGDVRIPPAKAQAVQENKLIKPCAVQQAGEKQKED